MDNPRQNAWSTILKDNRTVLVREVFENDLKGSEQKPARLRQTETRILIVILF